MTRRRLEQGALAVAVGLCACGCRLDLAPEGGDGSGDTWDTAHTTSRCIVVATSEFRSDGGVSVIDSETFDVWTDVTAIHADAVLRAASGRVFVINRQGGDSVQELAPAENWRTVFQRSVGTGTNPVGLTLLQDGTAIVPLYNEGTLVRVDPSATDAEAFLVGAPIAVPAHDEDDGRAEVLDTFLWRGTLYVIVQGLSDYPTCTPDGVGSVLAFDPATMEPAPVLDGASRLELRWCNPTVWSLREDGRLVIGASGGFRVSGHDADDGGLEVVDLAVGRSEGVLADERALGQRDIVALAESGDVVWVAVAGDDLRSEVVAIDAAGHVGAAVWASDVGGIFDLRVDDGRLWIADRSEGSPGVVVVDAADGAWLAGPLDTGFPPYDIDVVSVDGDCLR